MKSSCWRPRKSCRAKILTWNGKKLKTTETTEKKHQKVTEFYFRKDIVCMAHVMKVVITIHEKGGGGWGGGDDCANTMWQSICTWTPLIFVEAYPDISISICQVKVKSALLLNNTPLHQCRCETKKNLYDCLTKPFAINLYLKIFQIFNIMWGPNLFKRPDLILIRNKTIFE